MNLIKNTTVAAMLIASSANLMAQEVTFTLGGETTSKLVKQSKLDNFSLSGNSYFVTSYMESATMTYYIESYSDNGTAGMQGKLDVPVGVFNNSYGIDGVVGFGDQVYVLVEHLHKDAGKNTLSQQLLHL